MTIRWHWDDASVGLAIVDDGPGFPPDILDRIGDPYMSKRPAGAPGGGLGLGLFIAKTLLERSGAALEFRNASGDGRGATVAIMWPREAFRAPSQGEEMQTGSAGLQMRPEQGMNDI